jgi:hypothetical protein
MYLRALNKDLLQIRDIWYEGEYGSKTAVMDIIGFLYVSLGSSTVQLQDSLGSRHTYACSGAGFSSQNGGHAWGVCYRRTAFCCAVYCGQNASVQRIFIKKCFLFTVGSVCRLKRFTTGWQMFRWWRRSWNGGAEMAETTVKRLLRWGFRRTGKVMEQVYQCWWRICRELNVFFSRFEYQKIYVCIHMWPIYWLLYVGKIIPVLNYAPVH